MIEYLTFPTASRERAQLRANEAIGSHNGVYPTKIVLNAADLQKLRRNMDARHGYQRKPLDVFNIPIVAGDTPVGQIGFEWE